LKAQLVEVNDSCGQLPIFCHSRQIRLATPDKNIRGRASKQAPGLAIPVREAGKLLNKKKGCRLSRPISPDKSLLVLIDIYEARQNNVLQKNGK